MGEIALDELFEPASPLAARLEAEAPFDSREALLGRARELIHLLTETEKVATLQAHPRIGAPLSELSERSRAEQGADEVPELDRLNAAYEARFGFRFVVFVNGRSRAEIAEVLRERLAGSRQDELRAGLEAIVQIAEARLGGTPGGGLRAPR